MSRGNKKFLALDKCPSPAYLIYGEQNGEHNPEGTDPEAGEDPARHRDLRPRARLRADRPAARPASGHSQPVSRL